MSNEAVKAGQIIADEFLMRIARRYEHCNVNIYPDMPYLTPVEAVLRCAQEEGFILTNVIPGGPVGGAGELTAQRLREIGEKHMRWLHDPKTGAATSPFEVSFIMKDWEELLALAAKAPQGVPTRQQFECELYAWDEPLTHKNVMRVFDSAARAALPVPGPVSDDTIHHGPFPPSHYILFATAEDAQKASTILAKSEAAAPNPAPPTFTESQVTSSDEVQSEDGSRSLGKEVPAPHSSVAATPAPGAERATPQVHPNRKTEITHAQARAALQHGCQCEPCVAARHASAERVRQLEAALQQIANSTCSCLSNEDPNWHGERCLKAIALRALPPSTGEKG